MTGPSQSKTVRVRILGGHPHAGCVGTLTLDKERMRQGMLPVQFDDEWAGHNGADACFVRPEDVRELAPGEDVHR